jgi:hypothetical protein
MLNRAREINVGTHLERIVDVFLRTHTQEDACCLQHGEEVALRELRIRNWF